MKSKRYFLFFILILLITSIFFNTVFFYKQSKQQKIKTKADAMDLIDQRMKNTYTEISNFPSGPAYDILFLSKLSIFKKIITDDVIIDIENNFLEFLKQSDAYYQVGYIDKNGIEKILTEFDKQTYKIISNLSDEQKEKNKSDFDLLKNLKKEDVYVFPLGMEKQIPIFKYATPIFDQKNNDLKGIILVKIYADYFLEGVRRSQREGETTYLINGNGFYLANPDKTKEFGNLSKNEKNNFFVDYPDFTKELITKCDKKYQETDKQIITYRCIDPTTSNFEIYKGSKTINENIMADYQWLLVTVTNKSDGLEDVYQQKYDYLWVFFIQILIQGMVFILFLMNKKIYEKNN